MAKKQWHDINSPGFVAEAFTEDEGPYVESTDTGAAPEQKEPEVRLVSCCWLPEMQELAFNKPCRARVRVEFLKETIRTRVFFKLFGLYNGREEDLGYEVEGFVDDEGFAEADIMLYYIDQYYWDVKEDPSLTCAYKFTVRHSRGQNELKSDLLSMPATTPPLSLYVQDEDGKPIPGARVTLHTNEAFETDENGLIVIESNKNRGAKMQITNIELPS